MSKMLERLRTIDAELVEMFLERKKSTAIPAEMQEYILHLNAVPAIIHNSVNSMTFVTKALKRQFRELTFSQAKQIYYDAMNFFYIDDSISAESWDNYYAEQQEKLARLAVEHNKLDTASRCFEKSRAYRLAAAERIKPGEWNPQIFIISNKINPEDLGYKTQKIYDITKKYEEEQYAKMINNLPTSKEDKQRLMRDAQIEDAQIIEDKEDENCE